MCKVEDICRWDRCHCGLVDLEPSETRTKVRILNQRQVAAKIQQLEEAFLSQPGGSEGSGDSGEESSLPASSAEGARGCHDAG